MTKSLAGVCYRREEMRSDLVPWGVFFRKDQMKNDGEMNQIGVERQKKSAVTGLPAQSL